jgi:hypothetical protein
MIFPPLLDNPPQCDITALRTPKFVSFIYQTEKKTMSDSIDFQADSDSILVDTSYSSRTLRASDLVCQLDYPSCQNSNSVYYGNGIYWHTVLAKVTNEYGSFTLRGKDLYLGETNVIMELLDGTDYQLKLNHEYFQTDAMQVAIAKYYSNGQPDHSFLAVEAGIIESFTITDDCIEELLLQSQSNIVNNKVIELPTQSNKIDLISRLKDSIKQAGKSLSKVAIITMIATFGVQSTAFAFPDNSRFTITSQANQSLNVDQFGDDFTNSRTSAHLWDDTNLATAGLVVNQRGQGNSAEIALLARRDICIAPDVGLNAGAITNGTSVIFKRDCANSLNWILTASGEIKVGRNQAYCLDVPAFRFNKQQKLHVWTCNGSSAQKWLVRGGGGVVNKPVVQPVQPVPQPNVQPKPAPQPIPQPAPKATQVPKLILKTQGIGWNAPIAYDLNILSPTFNYLLLGDGKKTKVNVNVFGHTWTYFGKDEGQYLVYNLKLMKNDLELIKALGGGSFLTQLFAQYGNPAIALYGGVGGAIYSHASEEIIIKAEHCLAKDSGFWLDADGGALFLNPVLKCDK